MCGVISSTKKQKKFVGWVYCESVHEERWCKFPLTATIAHNFYLTGTQAFGEGLWTFLFGYKL